MSNERERKEEERRSKERAEVCNAVEFALEDAVDSLAGSLTGITVIFKGYEVLLVVKARFNEIPMVAFCASSDWGHALRKAVREARANRLRWKTDTFRGAD